MSNHQIYVVDDSVSVLVAVERMLHARGFEVMTERSGVAAVDHLRTHRPDLLICDLVLPDVDGTEICALASGGRGGDETPVIAISGLVDDDVRTSAHRAGAVRVLEKPFEAPELLAAIEEALAAKPAPAARPPDPVATPEPVTLDAVADLLDRLGGLPGFRFGCLLRSDGELVERFGTAPAQLDAGIEALSAIARRAAALAAWLGGNDPHQLVLEASGGFAIAGRAGPDHLVALIVEGSSALGKARLMLNRLHRRAGRVRSHAVDPERSLPTHLEVTR